MKSSDKPKSTLNGNQEQKISLGIKLKQHNLNQNLSDDAKDLKGSVKRDTNP